MPTPMTCVRLRSAKHLTRAVMKSAPMTPRSHRISIETDGSTTSLSSTQLAIRSAISTDAVVLELLIPTIHHLPRQYRHITAAVKSRPTPPPQSMPILQAARGQSSGRPEGESSRDRSLPASSSSTWQSASFSGEKKDEPPRDHRHRYSVS